MFKLRKFSDMNKINENTESESKNSSRFFVTNIDGDVIPFKSGWNALVYYFFKRNGDDYIQTNEIINMLMRDPQYGYKNGSWQFDGLRFVTSGTTPSNTLFSRLEYSLPESSLLDKKIIDGKTYLKLGSLADKCIETSKKTEKPTLAPRDPKRNKKDDVNQNPFKQAICVIGESGAGKSVTIERILENEGHQYEFIIPTESTTGLLSQFSPRGRYVRSILSEMIIEAASNPGVLYTAVFDEMHKSKTIEMINDELLQCISLKRNNGVRFISLDPDTVKVFEDEDGNLEDGLKKVGRRLIIPDNLGFIFISSKEKVIKSNSDFFNRVDIIKLEKKDRIMNSSNDLLSKVMSEEEKKNMVPNKYE